MRLPSSRALPVLALLLAILATITSVYVSEPWDIASMVAAAIFGALAVPAVLASSHP
jgi:hypothetical protein